MSKTWHEIFPHRKTAAVTATAFFVLCLVGIIFFRATLFKNQPVRQTRSYLGTVIDVDVCPDGQAMPQIRQAFKIVWKRFAEIEQRMSFFDADSDIGRLNRAYPESVRVHADTYAVLRKSIAYSQLSRGAFDITVGALVDLWRQAGQANAMPPEHELKQAREKIGMDHIQLLDDNQVKLLSPGVSVDLGAIAKGYAVDEAAKILRQQGFLNFLINAGGDIYSGGRHCTGRAWAIGIRNPLSLEKDKLLARTLEIQNAAVTTSGDYERYYEINGTRWSHIIDPRTGYPARRVASATVVASTALEADALSTALCVLGGKEGAAWIHALEGYFAAYIIEKDEQGRLREYRAGRSSGTTP